MNKSLIGAVLAVAAGAVLLAAAVPASASDRVNWSLNIGVPGVIYPAPVYAPPPAVYVRPEPVYVEPPPVYYQPRPVYVPPPAVYGQVFFNAYSQPYYWDHGRRVYGYPYGYGHHHHHGHW